MSQVQTREGFRLELGGRLRSAREALGFSYGDLSERTGISRGSLGDFEQGRSEPGSWVLSRLVEALGADAGELLGIQKKRKVRK
jgi:transcriptional regulator with XRE-family HTH domain